MFELASPWWLVALPAPWALWFMLRRHSAPHSDRGESPALFHPQAALLARLATGQARASRGPWLWWLGCVLLMLALARPQWVTWLPDERLGRDLLIAIDVSGSMRAQDFVIDDQPVDRLVTVQRMVDHLLSELSNDRAGLLVFADDVYTLAPLTHDLALVRTLLGEITHDMAGEKTALGDAVAMAVKRLRERPPQARILLLFTDGTNTTGQISPPAALELARRHDVRIYTLGIGTDGRVAFPRGPRDGPLLTEMPLDQTGGRYYRVTNSRALGEVLTDIDRLETLPLPRDIGAHRDEWYWLPLLLGLSLLWYTERRGTREVLP